MTSFFKTIFGGTKTKPNQDREYSPPKIPVPESSDSKNPTASISQEPNVVPRTQSQPTEDEEEDMFAEMNVKDPISQPLHEDQTTESTVKHETISADKLLEDAISQASVESKTTIESKTTTDSSRSTSKKGKTRGLHSN